MSASQSSKSTTQSETKAAHTLTATPEADVYTMFSIHGPGHAVTLTVDGHGLQMELDTGSAVSVMSEATYKAVWNVENLPTLQPSQVHLHMYTGDINPVLGMMYVCVQHNQQIRQLPLLIEKGDGPTLSGRDWLIRIHSFKIFFMLYPCLHTLSINCKHSLSHSF